jgi:hypothetical protein
MVTLPKLRAEGGYTVREFREAGHSLEDLHTALFTADQLCADRAHTVHALPRCMQCTLLTDSALHCACCADAPTAATARSSPAQATPPLSCMGCTRPGLTQYTRSYFHPLRSSHGRLHCLDLTYKRATRTDTHTDSCTRMAALCALQVHAR